MKRSFSCGSTADVRSFSAAVGAAGRTRWSSGLSSPDSHMQTSQERWSPRCSKESIICVGSSYVPRITPNDVSSLSIVNGTFSEVKEAMFAHMPSLQLL
ncbi:hypothetical protein SRHO_G00024180 [Serrasalmus rhombeus]